MACPRSHSTRAISNAKIKTVKLTVVVVAGYLICSAPFVCIQLYAAFGNPTINMSKLRMNTVIKAVFRAYSLGLCLINNEGEWSAN